MRLSILLLVLVAIGCDRSDSGKPVEIGHIVSSDQADEEKALKLAVDELNQDTGALPQGRRLHLRHAPGGSTADEFGFQATRLVSLNRVSGLVGGNRWTEAEKLGVAIQPEKVIAVTSSGWAGASPSQNLFCVGLAPAERGRVLALVAKDAKAKRIVVVRDTHAKAAGVAADRFSADCRAMAATITEFDVGAVRPVDADLIYFACSAAQAVRLRIAGTNAPIVLFGDEDAELPALLSSGSGSEGFQVATAGHATAPSERLAAFVAKYQQTYQKPPSPSALLAHDALSIWVEAAKRSGGYEADGMRNEFLKREKPFDSLTGPLTFADDHTARRPIFVGQIKNGQLAEIRTFDALGPK